MTSEIYDPTFYEPGIEFSAAADRPRHASGDPARRVGSYALTPTQVIRKIAAAAIVGAICMAAAAASPDLVVDAGIIAKAGASESPGDMDSVLHQLADLGRLTENWDSYGAPSPDPAAIDAASRFWDALRDAASLRDGGTPPVPSVQASAAATVGFAWSNPDGSRTLEVEAHPDGVLTYVQSNGNAVDVGTVESESAVLDMLRA
jgi:hypothetical protein